MSDILELTLAVLNVYVDNVSIQDANCSDCRFDLTLNDHDIFGRTYQVETIIESNWTVDLPNDVIFKASEVLLENDFKVVNGATFEVILDPCQ